ncbi:MAG: dephospho-CoA kinase [Eggerthellaceae bacterium]|nr:dephospho-CoA kinase [Eggerthellaceae bacterium]
MKKIFIIGGIGAGKSSVLQTFAALGIPVLDLDKVGHAVLDLADVKAALVEAFGTSILDENSEVKRRVLASYAFLCLQSTEKLIDITSPAILEKLQIWLAEKEAAGNAFAVIEVSAYDGPEGHYTEACDYVVAVCAPSKTQLKRARARGLSEIEIQQRIAVQPSDEARRTWADCVIENDGDFAFLEAQVKNFLASIS